MKLIESNPHLCSAARRKELLFQFARESSAIEGIHHPFAKGNCTFWPKTMDELVTYWKKRVASSAQSRKAKSASSGA